MSHFTTVEHAGQLVVDVGVGAQVGKGLGSHTRTLVVALHAFVVLSLTASVFAVLGRSKHGLEPLSCQAWVKFAGVDYTLDAFVGANESVDFTLIAHGGLARKGHLDGGLHV